jgi:hypothetical protein
MGRYMSAETRGRYTKPISKSEQSSPRWYGRAILGLLLGGTAVVTLNYLHALPGAVSSWYLIVGLALIFGGFVLATRYK